MKSCLGSWKLCLFGHLSVIKLRIYLAEIILISYSMWLNGFVKNTAKQNLSAVQMLNVANTWDCYWRTFEGDGRGANMMFLYFWLICRLFFWNYLPWWADIATSTKQLELSTPEKNTGYETQHPSWFKSMKKASSQKKNTQNSFGLLWFFLKLKIRICLLCI